MRRYLLAWAKAEWWKGIFEVVVSLYGFIIKLLSWKQIIQRDVKGFNESDTNSCGEFDNQCSFRSMRSFPSLACRLPGGRLPYNQHLDLLYYLANLHFDFDIYCRKAATKDSEIETWTWEKRKKRTMTWTDGHGLWNWRGGVVIRNINPSGLRPPPL